MAQRTPHALAWVESPLQFVSAAELADARGRRIRVVFRLGPQMSQTAAELVRRDAPFSACLPYVGIPWAELRRADEWIVGDGLSGQFQLACAVLRPRSVTLLDDGGMSAHLAAALSGSVAFARPGRRASGVRGTLAELARDHLLRLAGTGRLTFSTAFAGTDPAFDAAARHGVRLRENDFAWTRRTARAPQLPGRRVLLGSARVVDGFLSRDAYLAGISRLAAQGPLVYLPHRREPSADVDAVRAIGQVTVIEPDLPAELFLAGAEHLELVSAGSSADVTLARVLDRSGHLRLTEPGRNGPA